MRFAKFPRALFVLLLCALHSGPVQAQMAGQLLQGLSQSDREALLEQVAGDSVTRDRSSGTEPDPREDERSSQRGRDDAANEELIADVFAEGDSVIIDIQLIVERPAQVIERGAGQLPLILPAIEAPDYTAPQRERLQSLIDRVRRGNPYVLGEAGELLLPGLAPIILGGLDDELATARLSAESALADLQVSVKRLPVEKTGIARLKPFGYDLFTESPSTFAPVTNIPAPADYLVGSGDQLIVQLFGAKDRTIRLTVDREGQVNFPELGPIPVTGLRFAQVREVIETRVSEQMIGVQANISLGDTRSIQVLVTGDVNFAGTYTLSGLATITSAIYAAGGIAETGSFRQIEQKRAGEVVGQLDLYDLLLKGDSSGDQSLRAGDVIFVRPLGETVAVDGAVRRPGIYERRATDTLKDMIAWAGGATPEADLSDVTVVALDSSGQRRAIGLDITEAGQRTTIQGVSEIQVRKLTDRLESAVFLQGYVDQSGARPWFEGMTIRDVLPTLSAFKEGADTQYVLIRRELPDRTIRMISVDMLLLLASDNEGAAPTLSPRDTIFVFDSYSPRLELLRPLLRELRAQAGPERRTQIVSVGGEVRWPGDYPLEEGMRISDLVRAAGGLTDRAYRDIAEITRVGLSRDARRAEMRSIELDLLAALSARGQDDDLPLESQDTLLVKPVPQLLDQATIILQGEVVFPGEYPIKFGETLRSVIERAGGLTAQGFSPGAIFTRESLRVREQQRIDDLEKRLRQDLATTLLSSIQVGVSSATQPSASPQAFGLLDQLETTEAVGRLVIDLDAVLAGDLGSVQDILLRDGDRLVIPVIPQEVTVIGEVQLATSHLYQPDLELRDYLSLSGGATERGDIDRIYVIKADGRVQTTSRSWFASFANRNDQRLAPGDTIVVPPDLTRLPPLPLWQAVTSIIYNAAVAVAAIGSL